MALDNLEGIREYRDRLVETADREGENSVVAALVYTSILMLDTLFGEIDRLQKLLDTGKQGGSVEVVPLHKRRKLWGTDVRDAMKVGNSGPDLV